MTRLLPTLLVLLACSFGLQARADAYTKTSEYQKERIGAFTLMVHPDVAKHPKELKVVKQVLADQIRTIERTVPFEVVKKLRKATIWLEWGSKGTAGYHPSAEWLKNNGYNPDKAKAVDIVSVRGYLAVAKGHQPFLLLHELAHFYHDTELGYDHKGLVEAYERAKNSGTYNAAKHADGGTRQAYAMTNVQEYFAELTEAYFGKNDFYPFNEEDLKKHDPEAHKLLKKLWKD